MSKRPFFSVAQFVVEATSPISIAGGAEEPNEHAPLSRDPNGLPFLPGTSIAGVLRHSLDPNSRKILLGDQVGQEGTRSLVEISDGLIHSSEDTPLDGLNADPAFADNDPLLKRFSETAQIRRDHAAISQYGVVDGAKKFDRLAVPAGARFTFELSARHSEEVSPFALLAKAIHSGLTVGSATRSGYGGLKCVRSGTEKVDLSTDAGRNRYLTIGNPDLSKCSLEMNPTPPSGREQETLKLMSDGPLLIGGESDDQDIDSAPYSEEFIKWEENSAQFSRRNVIPGSAIKGPLRHRTEFYLRKAHLDQNEINNSISQIFGAAREQTDGRAGSIRFHDSYPVTTSGPIRVPHVGIDRFTSGARNQVLFTTEMLWQPRITVTYEWLEKPDDDQCIRAFNAALSDLRSGHLGIGADWGDGCGILREELQHAA